MANKIILKKSSVASKVPLAGDLEIGELAVNLTDKKLYSKDAGGTVIELGGSSGTSQYTRYTYTATGGQTTFAAAYTVGYVNVFLNGVMLAPDDYTATTGTNIVLATGAVAGDIVDILAWSLSEIPTVQASNVTGDFPVVAMDTTYAGAIGVGEMAWDSGNQSPSIGLNANVTLQLGQENVALVYNGTGSTIANGQVVAVSGAQGQRPSVILADASGESSSAPTFGIATESIANGAEGFVTTFGLVRGLDTSGFTAGAPIYLSTTAGAFTATRPSAPDHTVFLGWVIKVNASSGEIFVNINNGWELDELHNVLITDPQNGQVLAYNSSTGVWENETVDALPSQTGNNGKYLTTNGTTASWASIAGGPEWQSVQTSNFTATAGNAYPIDTTSSSITVTLPSSPTAGQQIILTDYAGTWNINGVIVNPNGNKVLGNTLNGLLAIANSTCSLVYVDSTKGWISYSNTVPSFIYSIDYLIVAGGGGGGNYYGGGGGGGGLLTATGFSVTPLSTYTVTIGAGGVAGTYNVSDSTNGGNSVFGAYTAIGGGKGASRNAYPAGSGGSGGGGSSGGQSTGGSGTSGQGYAGGTSTNTDGNGGGGAGEVGGTDGYGYGGDGVSSSISGTLAYYAGGGGGGAGGGSLLPGGDGGGGSGGAGASGATAGLTNTGGGGGGASGNAYNAANGGSGIVIIRYAGAQKGTGGTVTSVGGYTIHTFTTSGTFTA